MCVGLPSIIRSMSLQILAQQPDRFDDFLYENRILPALRGIFISTLFNQTIHVTNQQ